MSLKRLARLPAVLLLIGAAFAASLVLSGCREPGPAEEAGRSIDEAVEDARDGLEELGENAEDWLDEQRDDSR